MRDLGVFTSKPVSSRVGRVRARTRAARRPAVRKALRGVSRRHSTGCSLSVDERRPDMATSPRRKAVIRVRLAATRRVTSAFTSPRVMRRLVSPTGWPGRSVASGRELSITAAREDNSEYRSSAQTEWPGNRPTEPADSSPTDESVHRARRRSVRRHILILSAATAISASEYGTECARLASIR